MKYYIIKDKKRDGYLSRTLCRVNDDGSFEEYSCNANSSSGKWIYNEIVEKWFKGNNDNYEVYEPNEKEIEEVKFETDDAAYDNFHEHYNPTLIDSKGRKHTEYIYQDYRSLDGYYADGGFEYNEIWSREDYDYYLNTECDLLMKKDKETNDYYIIAIEEGKNSYFGNIREWVKTENIDLNKLKPIKDFEKVINLLEHYKYSMTKFDYLERIKRKK